MRLTEKDITYITSGANVVEIPDIIEGHKYIGQAIIKLGQLEDIEDELGIDLIKFFKTLGIQKLAQQYRNTVISNSIKFNHNRTEIILDWKKVYPRDSKGRFVKRS